VRVTGLRAGVRSLRLLGGKLGDPVRRKWTLSAGLVGVCSIAVGDLAVWPIFCVRLGRPNAAGRIRRAARTSALWLPDVTFEGLPTGTRRSDLSVRSPAVAPRSG